MEMKLNKREGEKIERRREIKEREIIAKEKWEREACLGGERKRKRQRRLLFAEVHL